MATADANVLAGAGNTAAAEGDKPGEVSESENAHTEKVESQEATSEPERDELWEFYLYSIACIYLCP